MNNAKSKKAICNLLNMEFPSDILEHLSIVQREIFADSEEEADLFAAEILDNAANKLEQIKR